MDQKKVVVVGGGTGTSTILKGLRNYPLDITAIVAMSDSGGSTGILRKDFGILPTGDVRQCMAALMDDANAAHFNHRFSQGFLKGHSAGNISLAALTECFGSFDSALEHFSTLFSLCGTVIPVTLEPHELHIALSSGKILQSEEEVDRNTEISRVGYSTISLEPKPAASQKALDAIKHADLIVLAPGSLYQSILPVLLPEGIINALSQTTAKKVYVANLVNKYGHTTSFSVQKYLSEITKVIGKDVFDSIIVHDQKLELTDQVTVGKKDSRIILANLIGESQKQLAYDFLQRNTYRHDANRTAAVLNSLLSEKTVVVFDLDDTLYDRLGQIRDAHRFEDVKNITLLPGAKDVITNTSIIPILLTYGPEEEYQNTKIDVLGIRELFSEIHVCSKREEKQEILKKIREKYPHSTVISVGDRVDNEIMHGNRKGTITVHIKRGKYAKVTPQSNIQQPTFKITQLSELQNVLDVLRKHKTTICDVPNLQ